MREVVQINDKELEERATQLASICEEVIELKAEQKQINNDFKQRLEALQFERARLARIVRTKQEERDVEPPLITLSKKPSQK